MTGTEMIAAERERQVHGEGWTPEHDDKHVSGELAIAAACYAVAGVEVDGDAYYEVGKVFTGRRAGLYEDAWPWARAWDKREKHSRIRRLQIAGALIAAEIDRLMRKGETA